MSLPCTSFKKSSTGNSRVSVRYPQCWGSKLLQGPPARPPLPLVVLHYTKSTCAGHAQGNRRRRHNTRSLCTTGVASNPGFCLVSRLGDGIGGKARAVLKTPEERALCRKRASSSYLTWRVLFTLQRRRRHLDGGYPNCSNRSVHASSMTPI